MKKETYVCEHCDCEFVDEIGRFDDMPEYEDTLCPTCFEKAVYECDDCHGKFHGRGFHFSEDAERSYVVCDKCGENYFSCHECGYHKPNGELSDAENYICKECV